ncbi:MAG TPA: molybdopterin molybdenumtransferase MoeA, partial [Actinopolymorphaceae bacterium]
MISVDDHLRRVLETVRPLPPFSQDLLDAQGCALGEDVAAAFDLPSFDNTAMDGYALRAADVQGASPDSPVVLPVVGDLAAGPAQAVAVGHG